MLASAAMGLAPPATCTTLWCIHALVRGHSHAWSIRLTFSKLQMTWYLDLSDRDHSRRKSSQAWTCLGLAIRLAHGVSQLDYSLWTQPVLIYESQTDRIA